MSHSLQSIAFIPDGNRRYAQENHLSLLEAYQLGTKKAWDVFDWLQLHPQIKTGTFYTLSLENLTRQQHELGVLYKIFEKELEKVWQTDLFERNEARLKVIGQTQLLPKNLQQLISKVEEKTAHHSKKLLNLAIGYNGQVEIVDAAKKIAQEVKNGELNPESLNEKNFSKYLYHDFEAPDLIIRTSGTQRLSGFLAYQSAYSELYFCESYWPAFSQTDLNTAIEDFNARQRRFGK